MGIQRNTLDIFSAEKWREDEEAIDVNHSLTSKGDVLIRDVSFKFQASVASVASVASGGGGILRSK